MNGNSTIAWRKYEAAVDRLRAIYSQLETAQGREAVVEKLSISITRYTNDSPTLDVVGRAMAAAMKADAEKYLNGLIDTAQDDVTNAAQEVRDAVAADLKSKFMSKQGKGK